MPIGTTSELKAREALDRNPFPDVPWIRIRDDGIAIATGYSEALHRLLRWVPKARWRASDRCWLVPFSGAEAVRAVLPEIMRLAEAAQELDDGLPHDRAARPGETDLLEVFVAAATLLYGPDWRAILAREHASGRIAEWVERGSAPDPSDPLVTDLAGKLRQKAAAMVGAAERLESGLPGARGDDRT